MIRKLWGLGKLQGLLCYEVSTKARLIREGRTVDKGPHCVSKANFEVVVFALDLPQPWSLQQHEKEARTNTLRKKMSVVAIRPITVAATKVRLLDCVCVCGCGWRGAGGGTIETGHLNPYWVQVVCTHT